MNQESQLKFWCGRHMIMTSLARGKLLIFNVWYLMEVSRGQTCPSCRSFFLPHNPQQPSHETATVSYIYTFYHIISMLIIKLFHFSLNWSAWLIPFSLAWCPSLESFDNRSTLFYFDHLCPPLLSSPLPPSLLPSSRPPLMSSLYCNDRYLFYMFIAHCTKP